MTSQPDQPMSVDRQAQSVIFQTEEHGSIQYQPGDMVGDSYRLLGLIGQGGVGVVYRAQHIIIGQYYALKLLAPNRIDTRSWRRFEVEGRALARLKHENIVTIYNMGVDRKQCPYYVMDWLPGISLADRIRASGAISLSEALPVFLQICQGLECAHRNGIIHRDIKPANIMLVPTDKGALQVKIVDFGMARLTNKEDENKQALTALGEVFGSPLYMSPEQTLGKNVDARSDIYSLGCTLFEALTGVVPFRGRSAMETMFMHQEADLPTLASCKPDTEYGDQIEALVARCLLKDQTRRYQSVAEMAGDLKRILHQHQRAELSQSQHADRHSAEKLSANSQQDSQENSQQDSQTYSQDNS